MWPLPHINKKLITFSFDSHSIACGLIKPTATPSAYELYAYKKIQFSPGKSYRPYSSSTIQELRSFLSAYDLTHAFASFSIQHPAVTQMLITSNHAKLNVYTLRKKYRLERSIIHAMYLYSNTNDFFTFYLAAIEQERMFHYQLLALQLRLHLLAIVPSFHTMLTAYKHLYGSAFRQMQLAIDMEQLNNNLDNFCMLPIFQRIIITTIPSITPNTELPLLIPLVGLYVAEKDIANG